MRIGIAHQQDLLDPEDLLHLCLPEVLLHLEDLLDLEDLLHLCPPEVLLHLEDLLDLCSLWVLLVLGGLGGVMLGITKLYLGTKCEACPTYRRSAHTSDKMQKKPLIVRAFFILFL